MKLSKNRSQALVVIVFYKGFTAALLAFTSIALFFSLRNYENLANFSEDFALAGKFYLIK